MPRFFPHLTATPLQATTYLLGIALFSIAVLVFLNSSISFIITDVIGEDDKTVGDATGTLGFADELLALVACPLWGLVSDRVGVRTVAVTGYCIVGLSLIGLVQSKNVYPELLFARLAFSVGGAACSTMVTAVLPSMVAQRVEVGAGGGVEEAGLLEGSAGLVDGHAARLRAEEREARRDSLGHGPTPSMSSEVTITPTRYTSRSRTRQLRQQQQQGRQGHTSTEEQDSKAAGHADKTSPTSHLAGLVGLFTGAGALLALICFLPLPALFQRKGQSSAESLETTYYIVASLAFLIAVCISIGLRNLPGEETKTLTALFDRPYDESTHVDADGNLHTTLTPTPSYTSLVSTALKLGVTDAAIFLAYLAGFVARASSVAISLFIPLFINGYFKRTGLCKPGLSDGEVPNLPDIKKNCERAYILASALAGIAETAALLCAPIFGWVGARWNPQVPLLVAALAGVGGYVAFGLVRNPDVFGRHDDEGEKGGGAWAFLAVIAVGVSQIGSIVCSLGLLGRGINSAQERGQMGGSSGGETGAESASAQGSSSEAAAAAAAATTPTSSTTSLWHTDLSTALEAETAPLLPPPPAPQPHAKPPAPKKKTHPPPLPFARERLKGSIAGIYSFAGGAGILLLTKLGGRLFDVWTEGAPFFLMAGFNGVLGVAILALGAWRWSSSGSGSGGKG